MPPKSDPKPENSNPKLAKNNPKPDKSNLILENDPETPPK